ncbi:MAG: FUSC family protein, partial [Rhodococcus sp. (in: high G+C Gram-positive bacteria)]
PYPRRAGKIAMVGVLIVLFGAAGAAVGASTASPVIQAAAVSIGGGFAALLLTAFAITGPGPVILVFASVAAVGFAHTITDVGLVSVVVGVGAAVGWIASMLPALLHPVGPSQLAVARALAAVDGVTGRGSAAGEGSDQAAARAALSRARVTVALNSRTHRHRHSLGLATLLDDAEALLDAWARGDDPTHAHDLLAHERALRRMRRYDDLPVRAACLTELPRNFFTDGVHRLRSRALILGAVRITAAAALASWCATAFGFEHPLWAAMGALAAMQGITFRTTVERGIQRLLGNVGGAVVGAALIAMSLGYWQTVVAIVVFQVAAELLVLRNYGLTSLAVTPTALLLTGLAGHLAPSVAVSRIVDTLIGVAIGIVVAAVTIESGDRHHLA